MVTEKTYTDEANVAAEVGRSQAHAAQLQLEMPKTISDLLELIVIIIGLLIILYAIIAFTG